MYLDENEIVTDLLLYKLSEEQKKELMAIKSEDLIMCHHGFGQWIRNQYALWAPDNPHVVLQDVMHDNFPDQMSQHIIERVWSQLTGKKVDKLVLTKDDGNNYTLTFKDGHQVYITISESKE